MPLSDPTEIALYKYFFFSPGTAQENICDRSIVPSLLLPQYRHMESVGWSSKETAPPIPTLLQHSSVWVGTYKVCRPYCPHHAHLQPRSHTGEWEGDLLLPEPMQSDRARAIIWLSAFFFSFLFSCLQHVKDLNGLIL